MSRTAKIWPNLRKDDVWKILDVVSPFFLAGIIHKILFFLYYGSFVSCHACQSTISCKIKSVKHDIFDDFGLWCYYRLSLKLEGSNKILLMCFRKKIENVLIVFRCDLKHSLKTSVVIQIITRITIGGYKSRCHQSSRCDYI